MSIIRNNQQLNAKVISKQQLIMLVEESPVVNTTGNLC